MHEIRVVESQESGHVRHFAGSGVVLKKQRELLYRKKKRMREKLECGGR